MSTQNVNLAQYGIFSVNFQTLRTLLHHNKNCLILIFSSGGMAAWMLAINSFLADISKPEDRAFRYGMLGLAWKCGEPLGNAVGGYLYETGGYNCVFSSTLCGTILGAIVLTVMIKKYQWNPGKLRNRSTLSLRLIKDAFVTTFRKRKGPNRKYITILLIVGVFTIAPMVGEEFVVGYPYVLKRYGWQVEENSRYKTIISVTELLAKAIFLPLMKIFDLNEAWIMTFLFCTITTRHVVKALAYEPWLYYLGSVIDCIGYYALNVNKSMCSSCVAQNELGKLMAFYSSVESLAPIVIGFVYKAVWKVHFTKLISTYFLRYNFRTHWMILLVLYLSYPPDFL